MLFFDNNLIMFVKYFDNIMILWYYNGDLEGSYE